MQPLNISNLSPAENELTDTIENMSDAFFSIDKDWKFIRVNAHYEKVTGNKRDVVIGKDLREQYFSTPATQESKILKAYTKAMNERVSVVIQDYYERLKKHFEVRAYPKADGGLAIFFTDIDERVQQEKNLAIEKRKLEAIFYGSDSPMVLMRGPDLVFEMMNRSYTSMISGRDVIGKKLLDAFPEVEGSDYPVKVKNVYTTGESAHFYEGYSPILNSKTGQIEDRYFDATFSRISDGEDHDFLVIGNAIDVTDRVLSRKSLELATARNQLIALRADRERAKFEAAFHAVAEGIFIFDSQGDPVFMNDAAAKVFGSEVAADVRKRVEYYFERLDLYTLDDELIPLSEWPVAKALRGESFRDWQIKAHRRDTDDRWIWSSSGELALQSGSDIRLAVVVLRDITDQKQAELDLRAAKSEAERANELKSAFLANMSHEIRTPLGAMLGFSEILKDPALSHNERSNYVDILIRNGEQLSVIINDILDLSKVEAGHLTLEYNDTEPQNVCAEVISLLSLKAKDKDLVLQYKEEPSTPKSLVTDSTRLRQILLNLVGNAIKFTQFGSVTLRSYGCKNDEGRDALCVEVIDTGIGIPSSQTDHLFEMFVQADGSMTRRFGGTGLGLALSRRLARELGGDVSILETTEGKGTTFRIIIEDHPERRSTNKAVLNFSEKNFPELSNNMLKGARILIVDDSPDNRHLLWHILDKQGAIIDSAENGYQGYKKALAGSFDVVLMDIQMPEMDGYTATQKLRYAGYTKPIIALTAHAMGDVTRKCLNVGCSDHLSKPINPRALIGTIARFIYE